MLFEVFIFQFLNDKIHSYVLFDIIVNFIIQKLKNRRQCNTFIRYFLIFRAKNDCPNDSDKILREDLSSSSENDARSISLDSTMEEITQPATVRIPLAELEVTQSHFDAETFKPKTPNDS